MQRFNSYIIRQKNDATPAFCAKCKNDKQLSEYYLHSKRIDGASRYRPYCKSCRRKGPRKNWSRPIHKLIVKNNAQTCKICNVEKSLSEFYSNGCFADGTKKYRSRCKNCVLALAKQNQPKLYATTSQKRSSSPKNFITGILNHAAKRKQELGFNIDIGYLLKLYELQNGLCKISGIKMTYSAGQGRVNTNISLDRIDSNIGYIRGNVQFVCDVVNRMKQDMKMNEFYYWCKQILDLNNEKI